MLTKPQIFFLRQQILDILGIEPPPVFYIGGSETLPPPLEREEEAAAIEALEAGDEAARRTLIEHNLRLVVYIAKRFENTGINIEDLISIGTIGLIKSVNTFNSGKKIKLATYASRCIENEILMYLRKIGTQKTEVSFDEPLNTDWDGNELLLCPARGGGPAGGPGKGDHRPALRPAGRAGVHPEGGGRHAGHLPELYFAPGKAHHRPPQKRDDPPDAGIESETHAGQSGCCAIQ